MHTLILAGILALCPAHTIPLPEVPDIDTLPVCHVEDCSDVDTFPAVWHNDGNTYLALYPEQEQWLLITDDTVE